MTSRYKVYVYGSRKAFPVEGLAVGTLLPFDVFVQEGNVFTRLYGPGQLFGPEERDAVRRRGIGEVYVDARDSDELERYLKRTSAEAPADPTDPVVVREYLGHRERYFQVDRTFLVPGGRVGFGIYLLRDLRLVPVVEAADRGEGVIPEGLHAAIGDVVIRNEDIPLYQKYLDALLDDGAGAVAAPGGKERVRAVVIKERSKTIVRDLLEDPRSGEKIKKATGLVSKIADFILGNREVLYDLISLNSYDQYTYTHCVNVAVLATGIGIACGLDRGPLEVLGVGALLHDLGKSSLPPEILNKPGKLDPQEFEIIKTHVVEGEKILRLHEAIPGDSLRVVLQHHERLSGSGYPFGLSEEALHLPGRICAIADCYDAMTTHRPYQRALTPYQALLKIREGARHYDCDLLSTFVRMLGKVHAPENIPAAELSFLSA